ncbi:hypothetical protein LTR62_004755 [Meristemomyces frigidus]|uniref:Xylanolytic transcriptional activator regulatory domain-containing protein n=1 Tax=Meristemomyces frigidus TaxID=1508187 RepID=A0AAN7TF61_9PEZI|nr:hypothetical protein LTR62_004755 [Meristemomyces frigidus]
MDDGPPCVRCKKRGLPCTVNKSLQMILESDAEWKTKTDNRIGVLECALGKVAKIHSLPELLDYDMDDVTDEVSDPVESHSRNSVASSSQEEKHTAQNFDMVKDDSAGPGAIPGSVVSPVIVHTAEANRTDQDIITRGIVTLDQAQSYLDIYQNRLDHFVYRIMGDRRTLSQVRKASPLLLAAVCTVGALHLASEEFEGCYQEFVTIAATQTFSRHNTIDDVRGLLIGAFWLSGISWTCIGAAVRIATELQLHRSIFKALGGERRHYLRTRLYFLVYICDHHNSISYGRPPMTREDDTIRASSAFLQTEHAVEDDARLISQVKFWSLGTEIYETFGVDVEKVVTLDMIEPIRRYANKLDEIRAYWTARFSHNRYVGNYPRKGVGLHYHFAKLYLYSIAFRGIGHPGFKSPEVERDIDELATSALSSATAILKTVVQDPEIQDFLTGLPTYFDIMIAFAVVFVLKILTKHAAAVRIDTNGIHELVADLVQVLKVITSTMHPRHLLVSVARGAETLLERVRVPDAHGSFPANPHVVMTQPTFDDTLYDISSQWNGTSFDNFYMGEFDFLGTQEVMNNYQYQPDLYQELPSGMIGNVEDYQ